MDGKRTKSEAQILKDVFMDPELRPVMVKSSKGPPSIGET